MSDTPLKVSAELKDLVRYGAAVFKMTQGEFVSAAVSEYLQKHAKVIASRAEGAVAAAERLEPQRKQ